VATKVKQREGGRQKGEKRMKEKEKREEGARGGE
jgi:hypothetical protein